MVHPVRLVAAASAVDLQKRDSTAWSSVVQTTPKFWSEATSIAVYGYYTTTLVVSAGIAVISSVKETTSTNVVWATPPLMNPSPLDPACTTAFSALNRNLSVVTRNTDEYYQFFQVGHNPTCLPTSYYSASYYSPGICPSGCSIAFTPIVVSTSKLETAVKCCYRSYTWHDDFGCVSYLNPALATTDSGGPRANTATQAGLTAWTVVAEYTSVLASTSTYSTHIISAGNITPVQTTSTTDTATTTGHTIISGNGAAYVIGPGIPIRWASTDQAVLKWLNKELSTAALDQNNTNNGTTNVNSVSGKNPLGSGTIAGIVIGAVGGLALLIAPLVLFLCRSKQMRTALAKMQITQDSEQSTIHSPHAPPAYARSPLAKSELEAIGHYTPAYSPTKSEPGFTLSSGRSQGVVDSRLSELQATPLHHSLSKASSTVSPLERESSPPQWPSQSRHPAFDMNGFPISS